MCPETQTPAPPDGCGVKRRRGAAGGMASRPPSPRGSSTCSSPAASGFQLAAPEQRGGHGCRNLSSKARRSLAGKETKARAASNPSTIGQGCVPETHASHQPPCRGRGTPNPSPEPLHGPCFLQEVGDSPSVTRHSRATCGTCLSGHKSRAGGAQAPAQFPWGIGPSLPFARQSAHLAPRAWPMCPLESCPTPTEQP